MLCDLRESLLSSEPREEAVHDDDAVRTAQAAAAGARAAAAETRPDHPRGRRRSRGVHGLTSILVTTVDKYTCQVKYFMPLYVRLSLFLLVALFVGTTVFVSSRRVFWCGFGRERALGLGVLSL